MSELVAGLSGHSVDEHIAKVQAQIRAKPQDAGLRLALCHFLSVRGQWQRVSDQLEMARQLDASFTPVVATYSMALAGERQRAAVWAGTAQPLIVPGRLDWVDALVRATALQAAQPAEAAALRAGALADAPAVRGFVVQVEGTVTLSANGEETARSVEFDWLCDGDSRLGPMFEVLTSTGYTWVPMPLVASLTLQRPKQMMDLLWAPAEFAFRGGATASGLIPMRYPADLASLDDAANLGQRTEWLALAGENQFSGLGQRVWLSEEGEHSLLDVRRIEFAPDASAAA